MTTETLTGRQKAVKVREHEAYTMGTEYYHKHPLHSRLVYTDGIKFLAETCGAYWLIDLVASHQPGIRAKLGAARNFQVWRLRSYMIEAWSDTPDESDLLASQEIPYTDFPSELMPYEFWVEKSGDWLVMMMKAER